MVEEWCDPSGGVNIPLCIIPLWDVELAAEEIERNAGRGVRAICFSRDPDPPRAAEHQHRLLGPDVAGVQRQRRRPCACTSGRRRSNPIASPDAPPGVGGMVASTTPWPRSADWLFSGNLLRFPKLKLAYSEGQIGWIPYVLERADTVWEQHDSWQHAKERCPEPPST